MGFWSGTNIVTRHFVKYEKKIKDEFRQKKFCLFLDFDGTLTPIAPRPQDAHLDEFTRANLEILTRSDNCQVTIVSGRALADLQRKVDVPGATYVGNHGFEIQGPEVQFENNTFPECGKIFQDIMQYISDKLPKIEGIIAEDKRLTFSIHYRLVDDHQVPLVESVIQAAAKPFVTKKQIKLRKGKKVFEIRPPIDWHKGSAALWLLRPAMEDLKQKRSVALYIGDDDTDEDAFKALKNLAVTICVGERKESAAQFYLKDPGEVQTLVKDLAEIKTS